MDERIFCIYFPSIPYKKVILHRLKKAPKSPVLKSII